MKTFKVIKLKPIIAILSILIFSFLASLFIVNIAFTVHSIQTFLPYTIVLDAGHGGRDAGCSGTSTGVGESDINLEIVKRLKKQLQSFGFNVVLTRTGKHGLYSENVDNYKKDDMEKRRNIIINANADLVISIHQNSFPNSHERGAQAFYLKGSEDSKKFASSLQNQLVKLLPHARKEPNFGDYYLLKLVEVPTVILECGYLTNQEDEMLLQSDIYQERISYAIVCGVVDYFNTTGFIQSSREYWL